MTDHFLGHVFGKVFAVEDLNLPPMENYIKSTDGFHLHRQKRQPLPDLEDFDEDETDDDTE